MPRYEFSEGSSNKFWQIDRDGASLTIKFGKIGTAGQTTLKDLASEAAAIKEYDKLVAEKTKKGYAAVEEAAPAAKAKPPKAQKAKAAKAPAAPAKSNAGLEKAIDADPNNLDAWSVYGDWLQAQGDPRGELAAVQLGLAKDPKSKDLLAAEKKLFKDHGDALIGSFAKYLSRSGKNVVPSSTTKAPLGPDFRTDSDAAPMFVEWRAGFFHALTIGHPSMDWSPGASGGDDDEGGGYGSHDVPKLTVEVLASPAARFVTSLRLGLPNDSEDGECDYGPVIKKLAGVTDTLLRLRTLYIGDVAREESEVSWIELGDLSKLYPNLGKLRSLTLRGGSGLSLGKIDLPELRELTIITGGFKKKNLASILAAKWPKLERLELWLGTKSYGADVTIKDLAPLFDGKAFPKLTYLGLRNSEIADEIAAALGKAKIVGQLTKLDLSKGTLSDAGVQSMVDAKETFAHLAHLDLSDNYLKSSTRIAGTLISAVRTKPQRTADEYDGEQHRYVSLGE